MPVIVLRGLPGVQSNQKKDEIREKIIEAVISTKNLHLTADLVSVRMDIDALASLDPRKQIIQIYVELLYEKEGRTRQTLQTLKKKIARVVDKLFPLAKLIEAGEIETVNPSGVFVIRRKK